MPSVPEELNVFRRPHGLMVKLVKDIEKEVGKTGPTTNLEVLTSMCCPMLILVLCIYIPE